jgi:hypothetical protein
MPPDLLRACQGTRRIQKRAFGFGWKRGFNTAYTLKLVLGIYESAKTGNPLDLASF